MTDAGLTLYFSRGQRRLKVTLFEGYQRGLHTYEIHRPAWEQIEKTSGEIFAILQRANRTVGPAPEIFAGLKKSGQILYDLLVPSQAKDKLAATTATVLTLHLDDTLVHLPWELLHDGREFLCRRFAIGRIASTRQAPTARSVRTFHAPFRVLIVADPRGDLPACYQEGLDVKTFLDRKRNVFRVDFKSHPVDTAFVKKNIRDYDIVHYAGHAYYNSNNPSESGWLLSDATLTASEIAALGGFQPMPALLVCNACQSGRSDPWKNHDEIFGLANAFLLAGVQHYVGTFWEIVDEPGLGFAKYFYESIANGDAVGPALRSARRALIDASGAGSLTWANYMLYGEPSINFDSGKSEDTPLEQRIGWRRMLPGRTPGPAKETSRQLLLLMSIIGVVVIASIYAGFSLFSHASNGTAPFLPQVSEKASPGATVPEPAIAAPLSMTMNMIGQRNEADGGYAEIIVKEGSMLRSGDHFQVQVETNRPCYLYVLIYDSRGRANQLFPDPKIETPSFVEAAHRIAVPDKDLWFWLDERSGTETIYALASEQPMPDMRGLLSKMAEAGDAERFAGEAQQQIPIVERGVGGIAKGKSVSYPQSDGAPLRRVKKVTEVVASTGAVVRAISFEHR